MTGLIIVPIVAKTAAEALEQIRQSTGDAVELRLDAMDAVTPEELARLVAVKKTLVTNRRTAEGGLKIQTDKERFQRLHDAVEAGPWAVDVEIASPKMFIRRIEKTARKNGVRIIASFHDFKKTPPAAKLDEMVHDVLNTADYAKIACQPMEPSDVDALLELVRTHAGKVAAFALGEKSTASRIQSLQLGAPFGYARGASATAPGQITAEAMRKALQAPERTGGEIRSAKYDDVTGARTAAAKLLSARITARTQIVALIGDPVKHSLSPAIHNAAFAHLGMDWAYVALPVKAENLAQAVAGMRSLSFQGFNATMPHKQALFHLVDELGPFAKFCRAVNTVAIRDGKLYGHNTDGPGSLNALKEARADLTRSVVIGAGAAGSAMALALAQAGSSVTILNRDEQKGAQLSQKIARLGLDVRSGPLFSAAACVKDATVLCNATSVGMGIDESPLDRSGLHDGLTVLDAVYAPRRTRLVRDAEAAHAKTVTGDRMLLHQGLIAFWRWTGGKAPQSAMEKALEESFKTEEPYGSAKP